LQVRIYDELALEVFLHLDAREIKQYKKKHPFGAAVTAKWPDLQEDVQEGNKCLVMRRHTASVFHVMRVIEFVVQLLAQHYDVHPFEHGKEIPIDEAGWNKLLDLI